MTFFSYFVIFHKKIVFFSFQHLQSEKNEQDSVHMCGIIRKKWNIKDNVGSTHNSQNRNWSQQKQ